MYIDGMIFELLVAIDRRAMWASLFLTVSVDGGLIAFRKAHDVRSCTHIFCSARSYTVQPLRSEPIGDIFRIRWWRKLYAF